MVNGGVSVCGKRVRANSQWLYQFHLGRMKFGQASHALGQANAQFGQANCILVRRGNAIKNEWKIEVLIEQVRPPRF